MTPQQTELLKSWNNKLNDLLSPAGNIKNMELRLIWDGLHPKDKNS